MNPIEAVVLPLKEDAKKRARQYARETVKIVTKELAEGGNDLEKVAPYPRAWGGADYHLALGRYKLFGALTTWREASHRPGMPCPADVDPKKVTRFIAQAERDAESQYLAFIEKLKQKIGEVKNASLEGNHIWAHSILKVELPDGTRQNWKTQTIINVSKYGKIFNQFPTRKIKIKI